MAANVYYYDQTDKSAGTRPAPSPDPGREKEQSRVMNFLKKTQVQDLGRMVVAFAIAVGVYALAVHIMPEKMNFFLRHFLGVIVAGFVLGGLRAAMKGRATISGQAIALIMAGIFVFNISAHYFVPREGKQDNERLAKNRRNRQPAERVYHSEAFTLHPGEQWFPNHQFHPGEKFTVVVKFAPVKNLNGDGTAEIIPVGSQERVATSEGAPAFEGINQLSEVAVIY